MNTPSAQTTPQSLGRDEPVGAAVLQTATAPLDDVLGARAQVEVEFLHRIGSWAFLKGAMRGGDGGRPDLTGTSFAASQAAGTMSDVYVALLRKADSGPDEDPRCWHVADYAIGPTDVAWLPWPDKHEAPRGVFGF